MEEEIEDYGIAEEVEIASEGNFPPHLIPIAQFVIKKERPSSLTRGNAGIFSPPPPLIRPFDYNSPSPPAEHLGQDQKLPAATPIQSKEKKMEIENRMPPPAPSSSDGSIKSVYEAVRKMGKRTKGPSPNPIPVLAIVQDPPPVQDPAPAPEEPKKPKKRTRANAKGPSPVQAPVPAPEEQHIMVTEYLEFDKRTTRSRTASRGQPLVTIPIESPSKKKGQKRGTTPPAAAAAALPKGAKKRARQPSAKKKINLEPAYEELVVEKEAQTATAAAALPEQNLEPIQESLELELDQNQVIQILQQVQENVDLEQNQSIQQIQENMELDQNQAQDNMMEFNQDQQNQVLELDQDQNQVLELDQYQNQVQELDQDQLQAPDNLESDQNQVQSQSPENLEFDPDQTLPVTPPPIPAQSPPTSYFGVGAGAASALENDSVGPTPTVGEISFNLTTLGGNSSSELLEDGPSQASSVVELDITETTTLVGSSFNEEDVDATQSQTRFQDDDDDIIAIPESQPIPEPNQDHNQASSSLVEMERTSPDSSADIMPPSPPSGRRSTTSPKGAMPKKRRHDASDNDDKVAAAPKVDIYSIQETQNSTTKDYLFTFTPSQPPVPVQTSFQDMETPRTSRPSGSGNNGAHPLRIVYDFQKIAEDEAAQGGSQTAQSSSQVVQVSSQASGSQSFSSLAVKGILRKPLQVFKVYEDDEDAEREIVSPPGEETKGKKRCSGSALESQAKRRRVQFAYPIVDPTPETPHARPESPPPHPAETHGSPDQYLDSDIDLDGARSKKAKTVRMPASGWITPGQTKRTLRSTARPGVNGSPTRPRGRGRKAPGQKTRLAAIATIVSPKRRPQSNLELPTSSTQTLAPVAASSFYSIVPEPRIKKIPVKKAASVLKPLPQPQELETIPPPPKKKALTASKKSKKFPTSLSPILCTSCSDSLQENGPVAKKKRALTEPTTPSLLNGNVSSNLSQSSSSSSSLDGSQLCSDPEERVYQESLPLSGRDFEEIAYPGFNPDLSEDPLTEALLSALVDSVVNAALFNLKQSLALHGLTTVGQLCSLTRFQLMRVIPLGKRKTKKGKERRGSPVEEENDKIAHFQAIMRQYEVGLLREREDPKKEKPVKSTEGIANGDGLESKDKVESQNGDASLDERGVRNMELVEGQTSQIREIHNAQGVGVLSQNEFFDASGNSLLGNMSLNFNAGQNSVPPDSDSPSYSPLSFHEQIKSQESQAAGQSQESQAAGSQSSDAGIPDGKSQESQSSPAALSDRNGSPTGSQDQGQSSDALGIRSQASPNSQVLSGSESYQLPETTLATNNSTSSQEERNSEENHATKNEPNPSPILDPITLHNGQEVDPELQAELQNFAKDWFARKQGNQASTSTGLNVTHENEPRAAATSAEAIVAKPTQTPMDILSLISNLIETYKASGSNSK